MCVLKRCFWVYWCVCVCVCVCLCLCNSNSYLVSSPNLQKIHEDEFIIIQHVLDWTEACAISGDSMRNDMKMLRAKMDLMLQRMDLGQTIVAQERDKLMGQLALDTESVGKDTHTLSDDMHDPNEGALMPHQRPEVGRSRLAKLKPRLLALAKRWHLVHEAELALQLANSNDTGIKTLQWEVKCFEDIYDFFHESNSLLHAAFSTAMADAQIHLEELYELHHRLQERLSKTDSCVSECVAYKKMFEKLGVIHQNLEVLKQVDTSSMQQHHWQPVFDKSVAVRRGSQSLMTSGSVSQFTSLFDLDAVLIAADETPIPEGNGRQVLIDDIMKHKLSEARILSCLERMAILASQEKEVRTLLTQLEFQWRSEEWIFKAHMTSSGKFVLMVDQVWASRTVQDLEASVLALSVQVAISLSGSHGASAEGDDANESSSLVSSLKDEVEEWRMALIRGSQVLAELVMVQQRWTALQCLYHDPEVRLKQPKAARQFMVAEQQLLHVLRQMKEARSLMHYCNTRDPLILVPLHEKLDYLAEALSTTLDEQRTLFPRLFFMDDNDMIKLQYACVNDVTQIHLYLPQIFDGICDIVWAPTRSLDTTNLQGSPAATLAQSDLTFNTQRYPLGVEKPTAVYKSQAAQLLSRTPSGAFHTKSEAPEGQWLPQVGSDPRIASTRVAGVKDRFGQILLFQEASVNLLDDLESPVSSPCFESADAQDAKLHRFLHLVSSRASEELKQELVEARDELLLASDKGMSLAMDADHLDKMIACHSPQIMHQGIQMLYTQSIEQMFEQSAVGSSTLTRLFETASKGLVATLNRLLEKGRFQRLTHFHVMQRIAGTVVMLLSLRDTTDALTNASTEVTKSCDFAWMKVPRLEYTTCIP